MISIIIPIFKEADNIEKTSMAIDTVMRSHSLAYELVFVDDNSCDGTVKICNLLSEHLPIELIVRTKDRGLSYAVIEGLSHVKGDICVVMDADLSHPPSAILKMTELLQHNEADFVVGSRYIKGGSIDQKWSLFRRLNSSIATLPALFLAKIKDPMSGFFALRYADLPDIETLNPIGYKIGLEILVKGRFKQVKEIPIHFSDRQLGESKLSFQEQLKYLIHILRLYQFAYPLITKMILYGAVGFTGFLVDSSLYFGLQKIFDMNHILARAVSFWPAVTWGWALHRVITFSDRPRLPKRFQWMKFSISSTLSFCINWSVYIFLTTTVSFFQTHLFTAFITGILSAAIFNFSFSNFLIFPKRKEPFYRKNQKS